MGKKSNGTEIRRARIEQGLQQMHLAIRAKCSPSTISVLERGGKVRSDILARIRTALGLEANAS